jgi:hypothetical protein
LKQGNQGQWTSVNYNDSKWYKIKEASEYHALPLYLSVTLKFWLQVACVDVICSDS